MLAIELMFLVLSAYGIYSTNKSIKEAKEDATSIKHLSVQDKMAFHRKLVRQVQIFEITLGTFWLAFLLNLSRVLF